MRAAQRAAEGRSLCCRSSNVNDFMDGVGAIPRRPHRNDAALICRVSLTPVWERDGCTGSQLRIDPRAGGLDGVDSGSPVTADDVADAWWPCKIEVSRVGWLAARDWPASVNSMKRSFAMSASDTSFRARCFREITCVRAIKVWARSAVLMLLSAHVLWVQPRDIRHVPEHDRLTSRVTHFQQCNVARIWKRQGRRLLRRRQPS